MNNTSTFLEPSPNIYHVDEEGRLKELASFAILDTEPEAEFDGIVDLATTLFDTPISAITLVDRDRQWFKAKRGIDVQETSREDSFCSHAMLGNEVFVVPDARFDARFAENRLVTGAPGIRFYAGAPLRSRSGHNLGAMCIISTTPRPDFLPADRKKLEILGKVVSNALEHRKQANQTLTTDGAEVEEMKFWIMNTLEYATLLAEVNHADATTEKVEAIALAAWQQHASANGLLTSCLKSLRNRMNIVDYHKFVRKMPGFAI